MRGLILLGIVVVGVVYGEEDPDVFLKKLQAELKKRGNPWIAGTTAVSHLPWEEKKKLCCNLKRPEIIDKWAFKESRRARERRLAGIKPPSSWDWRNHNGENWMTSVKHQGNCGSCWAFAWVGMQEARANIITGDPDLDLNLSEQFILSCNPSDDGCDGGHYVRLGDWLKEDGVPDEDCFRYVAFESSCDNRCDNWKERGFPNRTIEWGRIYNNLPNLREVIKNEVMNGPVACAMQYKSDFFYYKGGVYTPIMGKELNHAVVICGWDDSRNAWLMKNSHGLSQPWFWYRYGNEGDSIRGPSDVAWMEVHPYNSISIEDYKFVEPNNELWEPGDTINIIITLIAIAEGFTNVSGALSTTDSDVTITTANVNFGSIPSNTIKDNSNTPFVAVASASASDRDVPFTLRITADGGYSRELSFELPLRKGLDYGDIVVKNATLTVTAFGSIGFDTAQGRGSGFIYRGIQTLWYGSMALGNSESYVVDNWSIHGTSDKDWQPASAPLFGRLRWVSPPLAGDTMLVGYYEDTGESIASKNIVCEQYAWGFKDPDYGDFVILQFKYINKGTTPVTGLYSAVFADFDIGEKPNDDNAGIDESKYLAWVVGEVYAGITLLYPTSLFKSASTISNKEYVYPNNGMPDTTQFLFMNRNLHFGNQSNGDFSAMVSAGPFDLPPGGSQIIAFALVGGRAKNELRTHADEAREKYEKVGVEEEKEKRGLKIELKITPNPIVAKSPMIVFSVNRPSNVEIDVYDITGRLVHTLEKGYFKAGSYKVKWSVQDEIPQGVFFVKLRTPEKEITKKVVILK